MKVNVDMTTGVGELFKHSKAAGVVYPTRLEAHPADLNDMDSVIDAPFRKRSRVPTIFREIDNRLTPSNSGDASVILHFQIATADRIGTLDAIALTCNIHGKTSLECWKGACHRIEMVVEINDYPSWLVSDKLGADIIATRRKDMKQTGFGAVC